MLKNFLTFLSTIHKLSSVHALSSNEGLGSHLVAVRIPEHNLGQGCATARVVDNVL